MKSKSPRRAKVSKCAPADGSAPNPSEEIPPEMKCLVGKTPMELIEELRPNVKHKAFAGLCSVFGFDLGVPVPEWVKAASAKFWQSIDFGSVKGFESGNFDDVGKMVGLYEAVQNDKSSEIEKAVGAFCQIAKLDAATSAAPEAKQFFDARADAGKILARVEWLPQRAKTFGVIAAAWEEVGKLQSAGELHRWLLKHKAIVPGTDASETRKVCKIIGLRFPSKAGRPSQKKSGAPR